MWRWLLFFSFMATVNANPLPFFAPAVPTGSLIIDLHPTENVSIGSSHLVTFGVPFPRGSLTPEALSTVRVLRNGAEIPAHVEAMTPWRHRSNPALDGTSVRVVLIQLQLAPTVSFPAGELVTVEWGQTVRSLDVPTLQNPRTGWHLVESGTFVASDGISEPDIYAVLPGSWLSQGMLRTRMEPFQTNNPESRDDPLATWEKTDWLDFEEAEHAMKNDFYTIINEDDPAVAAENLCPYKTAQEPWLYDRAATMFVLYFRSGYFKALREAVRATQFYASHLTSDGFFDLAGQDTKYAYNESLAYTYWATGDTTLLPKIAVVSQAHNTYNHAWSPARNFWTERHSAFKLLAKTITYEVSGKAEDGAAVAQILTDLRTHQDGANGSIPAERIDGGLYHTGAQHSSDWDDASLGGSPWMAALLSDAAVRAYATDEDPATANFIRRLGNFQQATIEMTTEHWYDTLEALAFPRYAMLIDGSTGAASPHEDTTHALEVGSQIAWAWYFSAVLGQPEQGLHNAALALYKTYDNSVNYWIRPSAPNYGLSAFRVSPFRKWGWQHRISGNLGFSLADQPDPHSIFSSSFEPDNSLIPTFSIQ